MPLGGVFAFRRRRRSGPGREAACGPPQAANGRHGRGHAGEAPKEGKEMYHPQCGGKRSRTVKSVAWGRSEGGWETRGRSGAKSPYRSTRGRPGDSHKACKDRPCRRTRSVGPYGGQGSIPHRERVAGTAPGWFFWAAERDRSPHRPCRKHRADSFRPPEAQEKDRFRNSLRRTKANTPSAKHAREKDGPSAGGCRPHGSAPSRRRAPRRAAGGGNGRLSLHFRSASSLNTGIGQHPACSFLRNSRRIMRDTSRKASMRNDAARPT